MVIWCCDDIFQRPYIGLHLQICNKSMNILWITIATREKVAKVQLEMSYTWPRSRLRPCSMSWTPIRFSVSNFQMLNLSLDLNKKGSRALTISIGNITRSRWGSWPGNLKCLPTGFTVFSWQAWVAVPRWFWCRTTICAQVVLMQDHNLSSWNFLVYFMPLCLIRTF